MHPTGKEGMQCVTLLVIAQVSICNKGHPLPLPTFKALFMNRQTICLDEQDAQKMASSLLLFLLMMA